MSSADPQTTRPIVTGRPTFDRSGAASRPAKPAKHEGEPPAEASVAPAPAVSSQPALPPTPIVPVSDPLDLPRAPVPAQDPGCIHRYVNVSLNSRLTVPLPQANWRLRWRAALAPGLEPEYVLSRGDETIVVGGGLWQRVGPDGAADTPSNAMPADVAIDPAGGYVVSHDRNGALAFSPVTGGGPEFVLNIEQPVGYARAYIARVGRFLYVLSVERPRDPHLKFQPSHTWLELHELPAEVAVDDLGVLAADTLRAARTFDTVQSAAAIAGGALVAAVPGELRVFDLGLNPVRVLADEFEPQRLSLDEAARSYLIAEVNGRRVLRVITVDGDQLYEFELPSPLRDAQQPPIIGYDHRAFLITATRLAAIDTAGELLWIRPALAQFGGASVTGDDKVLASDGAEIVAFGATGERVTIHTLDGARLTTAPILTDDGRLLVAGHDGLYCLEPAGR